MTDERGLETVTGSVSAGLMPPATALAMRCDGCGTGLAVEDRPEFGLSGLRCPNCDAYYTLSKPEKSLIPTSTGNPHRYVKPEPKVRSIAIIGKAPSSMMLAPFETDWEIWSINDSVYRGMLPRCDRQFELHNIELTQQPVYDKYYQWLCDCTIPVYVNADYPEIKNRVIYPRYEIVQNWPIFEPHKGKDTYTLNRRGTTYYTNSISYLVALAVYELQDLSPEDRRKCFIGLWGVDMAQHGGPKGSAFCKSEYATQRPSVELACGWVQGAGINLVLPGECDLLKCRTMYGFDTYSEMAKKLTTRRDELEARVTNARQRAQAASQEADFLTGALEDVYYQFQWL